METADGQDVGTVERIIVDLETNEVTHYVVHSEVGRRRDLMVPAVFTEERGHILSLRITPEELANLPEYLEVKYGLPPHGLKVKPGEGRPAPGPGLGMAPQGLEGRTVELTDGEPVECEDGEVGSLKGIVVDELTDEVTDLVVEVARWQKFATVPTVWASRLGPTRIQLQCAKSEVEGLVR